MASNTAWGPWIHKDGFNYRVKWDGIGYWYWEVVDSAYGPVSGGSGSIAGDRLGYAAARASAIDFIENHDDDEYFEDPEVGGEWKEDMSDRCYTIEMRNTTLGAGIGLDLYVWRVKDIGGVIKFTQSYPQQYAAAQKDAREYLATLPYQEGCDKGGGGGGGGSGDGIETDTDLLKLAGIFVVGVNKGTLTATIPIITMSVAVGFMKRIVRIGVGVGN